MNEFKVGDFVECIDNDNGVHASQLTIGKHYQIEEVLLGRFCIYDNTGTIRSYFKRRFNKVNSETINLPEWF